jgi:hypothetical protein
LQPLRFKHLRGGLIQHLFDPLRNIKHLKKIRALKKPAGGPEQDLSGLINVNDPQLLIQNHHRSGEQIKAAKMPSDHIRRECNDVRGSSFYSE